MADLQIWLEGPLGLVLLGAALPLAFGWYLSYLAARLDRLHHRVESSRAALEAQLARRAAVAIEVGQLLGPPGRALIRLPAQRSSEPGVQSVPQQTAKPRFEKLPIDELSENELTRALHRAFADPVTAAALRADPAAGVLLDRLVSAGDRVQLARRFHNDVVAHAQRMRRKWIVRWARLAGRAQLPQMIEIDDSQPIGLTADLC